MFKNLIYVVKTIFKGAVNGELSARGYTILTTIGILGAVAVSITLSSVMFPYTDINMLSLEDVDNPAIVKKENLERKYDTKSKLKKTYNIHDIYKVDKKIGSNKQYMVISDGTTNYKVEIDQRVYREHITGELIDLYYNNEDFLFQNEDITEELKVVSKL